MKKYKVLIINPKVPVYRVPIFNEIGNNFDLTVLHSGSKIESTSLNFIQETVSSKDIGPFNFSLKNLHKFCNKFDVVISEGNIRYLDRALLALNPFRYYKWIYWGIGVSASYNKKFDSDKKLDFVRHFIFSKADANIFYSEYPISKYVKYGVDRDSLFVANNTTAVLFDEIKEYEKDSLLFVGTLYKQKKIYELLDAYQKAAKEVKDILPLVIIGDGEERENIESWVKSNGLSNKIEILGSIFDQNILEKYFRKALACISPGQAGLSVLTSMGYGTPFITKRNAITGGEIFNISNGVDGVLYDEDDELKDIILDILRDNAKYVKLGNSARLHYKRNRMPGQMVQSIVSAINYVLNKSS
jgi:glycosyltransferase involved in cell wall biosynthesis